MPSREEIDVPWSERLMGAQVIQLTLVRLYEFVREPEALFWVFGVPLLLAGALGIAFRDRPAGPVRIGVVEPSRGSRDLVAALERTPELRVERFHGASEAGEALRRSDVALVLAFQAEDQVEYRYDPTRPDARSARLLADGAVQRAAGRRDPVAASDVALEERGARYIDFLLPGLLGMNLMASGIGSVCFVIVDMRRRKLLKRLAGTPMSRGQLLASFLLSRVVLASVEVGALLAFGIAAFKVPIRGSIAGLALLALLASVCFGGLGLLISSRAKTMEAVSGLSNLVMMPMWVLSGIFFASSNFPSAIQPLVRGLPLTAVNDALRAHLLRGTPLSALAPQLAVIAAWTMGSYALALRRFRWQ